MPSTKDITVGQRFGRWTVESVDGYKSVVVMCDCGTRKTKQASNLLHDGSKSCGCYRRDDRIARNMIAGQTQHPRYEAWAAMVNRCHRPNDTSYPHYGGRGIRVYEPWRDSAVFLAWLDANLGPCPPGSSLDRIDNDGDYAPGNLRWANNVTQRRNQRRSAA